MNMTAYVKLPKLRLRAHDGPLGVYIDWYADILLETGYVQETGRRCLSVVAYFGRWLEREELDLADVDETLLDRFHRYRKHFGHPYLSDRSSLCRFLAMLRNLGVCRAKPPAVLAPTQQIAEEFKQFLLQERGLSNKSVARYLPFIH